MSTRVQANKAATKRKALVKNPSDTSGGQDSGGKKTKVSDDPGVMDTTSIAARLPASHLVREGSSYLTATEQNHRVTNSTQTAGSTKGNEIPTEVPLKWATATLGPQPQLEPLRMPNYTSSADLTVSQAEVLLLLEKPKAGISSLSPNRRVARMNHMVLLPRPNPRTIQDESLSEAQEPPLPPNRVTIQTKSDLFPFRNLPIEPSQGGPGTTPSISPEADGSGESAYNVNCMRVGIIKPTNRQFRGLRPVFTRKSTIPQLAGDSTPTFGAPEPATSGLTGGTDHRGSPVRSASRNTIAASPLTIWGLLPRKRDLEISGSIIRHPPRYSLRRQVEIIARILALTAVHGFSPDTSSSVPGDFLKLFTGLSRNYRYASTLAYTHLTQIEFPGKRTERWFKVKKIDEKVADVRPWYWHRVSERARVIEQFRTSWMERVWRFLMLASVSVASNSPTNIGPDRFGLWFGGVSQHLLADPDLVGQFETAIRFWIRRFYVWVTKSGGGYPQLLKDLREEMVQEIHPLDEKNSRELWRLETRCGGVYFIVGMTGEVVGWVEANGTIGDGLMSVRQRARTMLRTRLTVGAAGGTFPVGFSQGKNHDNVGNTWQDLRGDWREHASALLSSLSPSKGTESLPKGLLESVYCSDSKTVCHGIHESVKLPHHRLLAERWILAQVEAGGISGKPVLEGQAHRRERIVLDLQAKLTVESVRCSGEKWSSRIKGVLAQGLGFVQTPGMGWFVLEETGQVGSYAQPRE